jgi:hypothetical protein
VSQTKASIPHAERTGAVKILGPPPFEVPVV